jgi:flagellar basal-body rod protein FlgG
LLEGMYSAAAGMAAQQIRLDAVANDLANVSTTGYKHGRVAFRDLVYDTDTHGAVAGIRLGAGSAATILGRSMEQGAYQTTERSLDVAVQGPGFLQVKLADGRTALTRDGNLRLTPDGRLGLQSGQLLDPPIRIPAGVDESRISIALNGDVTAAGKIVGRIRLVEVPAPGALDGGPDNTMLTTTGSGAARTPTASVLQGGVLEHSNVDEATAMTDMIEAQRAFQLAGKAITTQDQILEIANGIKR